MKTPSWAIVIGICLMLFGGCSVIKNTESIALPYTMKMIKKMSFPIPPGVTDSLSQASNGGNKQFENDDCIKETFDHMQEALAPSEYILKWTVRFGYIGLVISIIYILSGVFLLIKRRFSIQLVYIALIISIVFNGIVSFVLALDPFDVFGFMVEPTIMASLFGIIIDIILMIAFFSIDKSSYKTIINTPKGEL